MRTERRLGSADGIEVLTEPMRRARRAGAHPLGQPPRRSHRRRGVARRRGRPDRLRRARQPMAERLRRELQPKAPRRTPLWGELPRPTRGPGSDRSLAPTLQLDPAPLGAGPAPARARGPDRRPGPQPPSSPANEMVPMITAHQHKIGAGNHRPRTPSSLRRGAAGRPHRRGTTSPAIRRPSPPWSGPPPWPGRTSPGRVSRALGCDGRVAHPAVRWRPRKRRGWPRSWPPAPTMAAQPCDGGPADAGRGARCLIVTL